jgi:hypothetical protein
MNLNDNIGIKGEVSLVCVDTRTGKVKAKREINNLVVQVGKDLVAAVFAGLSADTVTHVEMGTNTPATPVSSSQTSLVDPLSPRVSVTSTVNTGPASIVYEAEFGPGDATGSVGEAGLFTAASSGTMVARTTFSSIPKGADDKIIVTWTLLFG